MIRTNLAVMMAKRKCRNLAKISADTRISRTTLTNLYYDKSKGIQFETLDKLCKYLDCDIKDLIAFNTD